MTWYTAHEYSIRMRAVIYYETRTPRARVAHVLIVYLALGMLSKKGVCV